MKEKLTEIKIFPGQSKIPVFEDKFNDMKF